jgi:hypothetical protein
MSAPDFLIKNCPGNSASPCPTAWSRLRTSFSDAVRHCTACNRKVYLCQNEQDIKFYSSLKYPIAVDAPEAAALLANLPPEQPLPAPVPGRKARTAATAEAPVVPAVPAASAPAPAQENRPPSVWRRAVQPSSEGRCSAEDFDALPDMPAFMRHLAQQR